MQQQHQNIRKYASVSSADIVAKTVSSLEKKGYGAIVVENGQKALAEIKKLIPEGASLMNGASKTLEQIGFVAYLKAGEHGWNNLHEAIINEKDPAKQSSLRKQAELSDYYLGSMHALIENGEFVIASNTGSQLPHIVFTSPNLIFVVGTQKIVPDFSEAMTRLEEHVVPLENKNTMQKYGVGTSLNKIVIFKGENPMIGRKINVILVNEIIGF